MAYVRPRAFGGGQPEPLPPPTVGPPKNLGTEERNPSVSSPALPPDPNTPGGAKKIKYGAAPKLPPTDYWTNPSGQEFEKWWNTTHGGSDVHGAQGNEALYYGENNTIGLPNSYLTWENGRWKETQRGPEGPAGIEAGGTYNPVDEETHQAILRLLGRGEKPVTRADVEEQYAPAASIAAKNALLAKNSAAERQAFQGSSFGGAGGALDAEQNSITEDLAQNQAGLMAGLIGDEMAARRADVVNALQFAQGEDRLKLQYQLAQMDDQIRRQQLSQQNQQFYDEMGYNIGRDDYLFDQIYAQGFA